MRVYMSDDTQAYCQQWNTTLPSGQLGAVDIRRFQRLLADYPQSTFDDIELAATWGLLVVTLSGPRGTATKAVNLDLLCLTSEIVVKNDGTLVDRYVKLVEELFLEAEKKLDGPRSLQLT